MISKVFLLVAIFTVIAMAAPLLSENEEWEQFKQKHNKNYPTPEEEQNRFQIFKENLKKIKEHNEKYEKGEVTWTQGINQFTDLTPQEFKDRHTGLRPKQHE